MNRHLAPVFRFIGLCLPAAKVTGCVRQMLEQIEDCVQQRFEVGDPSAADRRNTVTAAARYIAVSNEPDGTTGWA